MNTLNLNSKVVLNNGVEMPIMGLGTYESGDDGEVENAVQWALQAGYRLIDTAMTYNNEDGVGRGIQQSGVQREEIFVTTKLWNTDQGYESTLQAIDTSLAKLGLEYVDLYLIHWPTADEAGKLSINKREETWKAMEEIYKSGKAKAIGVSNFTITHLEEMKRYATIMPAVNQVEFHPFLYQKELLEYCKENNIAVEAYRPLTKGKRLNNTTIEEIAKKYNKTDAQILLRWSIQHGCIPIPKSVHKERIEENIQVFNFELSDIDMQTLDELNENLRLCWDPTNLK